MRILACISVRAGIVLTDLRTSACVCESLCVYLCLPDTSHTKGPLGTTCLIMCELKLVSTSYICASWTVTAALLAVARTWRLFALDGVVIARCKDFLNRHTKQLRISCVLKRKPVELVNNMRVATKKG